MRSQAQILVLFALEIEQQISVWFSRRIDVRVQSIATVVWIQLFRQVGKLLSRGFLNSAMYCAFRLIVLMCLFLLKKF